MIEQRFFGVGDCCRITALSVLLLSIFLSFLLLHEVSPVCIVGILSAACGIIGATPDASPDKTSSRRAVLFRGFVALLPVPLASVAGKEALPAFYTLAVIFPMIGFQTVAVLRTAADREFLSCDLPGWEAVRIFSRQTFSAYPPALMALAWAVADGKGPVERTVLWCAVALLTVQLVVGILHSITHQSLLLPGGGEDGPADDDGLLRPHAPGRPSMAQRVLFDRAGRYMDEEKPYLDDAFSLDDMARALLTNKSYISKAINNCTGMNFSQFVNNYRVRHSMELYRKDPKLKVAELAALSGFHSNVTYNLAFKLFLDQTPSEWCRRFRERSAAGLGDPSRTQEAER